MVIKSPLCLLFNKLSRWSTLKPFFFFFLPALELFDVALSQPWLSVHGASLAELNQGTAATIPIPLASAPRVSGSESCDQP